MAGLAPRPALEGDDSRTVITVNNLLADVTGTQAPRLRDLRK